MPTIRVDPAVLNNSAAGVNSSAGGIKNAGNGANSAAASAPSYDGQFGPKVKAIGNEARAMASGKADNLINHGSKLKERASAFLAADTLAIEKKIWPVLPPYIKPNSISILRDQILQLLGFGWLLRKGSSIPLNFPTTTIPSTLTVTVNGLRLRSSAGLDGTILTSLPKGAVVTLTGAKEIIKDGHTWVQVTINGKTGWIAKDLVSIQPDKTSPDKNKSKSPQQDINTPSPKQEVVSIGNGPQINNDFFKTVTSDGPDSNYWRHGFDKTTDSDCTWYAAEAVKKASGGKIDLPNKSTWGNAYTWAEKASEYKEIHPDGFVKGIDKIPQAGDVMVLNNNNQSGHVAFVEKVISSTPDGTYTLVISEESADGKIPNWAIEKNRTNISSSNLRWQKTITIDSKGTKNVSVDYIHFKY